MTQGDALWRDLVFAVRLFRKSPVVTAATLLTLALGVGANVAVFSVVNAYVLRPLPVRDANRLVVIATHDRSSRTLRGASLPDVQDYRTATSGVFEDIAAYSVGFLGLGREGRRPERVLVTWVTGHYFPLLDLRPSQGRLIRADEGGPGGADAVVVLGYSTWQRRFDSDPRVVGQFVKVNGRPCTVIGVAPRDFHGTFAFSDAELYLPLNWAGGGDLANREARGLHAIARLLPGVSIARAQAAMDVVADRLTRDHPATNGNTAVRVLPERLARPEEDQSRVNAPGAAIMLVLVGLVMGLAGVNVSSLMLARTSSRRREFAIRSALGAGRGHFMRQLTTEALLLAGLGGATGVVFGSWSARALTAALPVAGDLPVRFDFQLDWRVITYAVVIVVGTGLLVGLASGIRAISAGEAATGRWAGRGSSASAGGHLTRRVLVVVQIAGCFVLLIGAGLFVRSLWAAERADLGFNPDGVLNLYMDVGQLAYTEEAGQAFFDDVYQRVSALPGIESASFAFTIPMGYIRLSATVEGEGQSLSTDRVSAGKNLVSPSYFQTMGIRLNRGRSFTGVDDTRSRPVAVVNQHFADVLWPGQDPIGRRFRSSGRGGRWVEVVGVADNGKYRFLFEDPQPYFYVPIAQEYTGLRVLQVRTSRLPETMLPALARALLAREPDLPLYDVQRMTEALGSGPGFFPVRVGAAAAATFGLLGLALAIVGIYGVMSYGASQRTHEMGVRIALGATRRDILRLVLRDGVRILSIGLGAGLVIALWSGSVLESVLFGVSGHDAITFAAVSAIVVCVVLAACTIPAWHAARVDPTVALRAE